MFKKNIISNKMSFTLLYFYFLKCEYKAIDRMKNGAVVFIISNFPNFCKLVNSLQSRLQPYFRVVLGLKRVDSSSCSCAKLPSSLPSNANPSLMILTILPITFLLSYSHARWIDVSIKIFNSKSFYFVYKNSRYIKKTKKLCL